MELTKKMLSLIVEKAKKEAIVDVIYSMMQNTYDVSQDGVINTLFGDTNNFKKCSDCSIAVLIDNAKDWMYSPDTLDTNSVRVIDVNNIRQYFTVVYKDVRCPDNVNNTTVSFSSYKWYEKNYAKERAAVDVDDVKFDN